MSSVINFLDVVKPSWKRGVDFDIDGVVFEIENPELKKHMGSNRKVSPLANCI